MKKIRNLNSQIIHLDGFGAIVITEAEGRNWLINLTPSFYSNDLTRVNIGINNYFELGSNLKKYYDENHK
ncbi:MAG: hypothetical protein QOH49_5188 [Acidobacteriota bacterium]|jgi:hypothetical protein|nr:hypothetical protein [Acidobacteriota bacterium]